MASYSLIFGIKNKNKNYIIGCILLVILLVYSCANSAVQRRRVKEAARGATRRSPKSLAYSGTFQKLLVLLR
ncbi:hypothetical protein ES332_A02G060200v1 [Gossypium tomentosum]|uniref:Uncharacterized protein n=1 Tax=Gossypium tomentosum TaxID=34277 RepID=A0A5D2RF06_GOSTO|nr:hypothetical protein ES332_A02G060200v1 [Gossypium tomentosum]